MKKDKTQESPQKAGTKAKDCDGQHQSLLVVVIGCIIYGVSSGMSTLSGKKFYEKFPEVSPMCMILMQYLCFLLWAIPLTIFKESYPNTLSSLSKLSLDLPKFSECFTAQKLQTGLLVGLNNLANCITGYYAFKMVNIPLFLAFRRCAILATIIVMYFAQGKVPSWSILAATSVIIAGAVIAGHENMKQDMFGFAFAWLNNFVSAICNTTIETKNKDKLISPIEIHIYSSIVGLVYTLTHMIALTDDFSHCYSYIQDADKQVDFLMLITSQGITGNSYALAIIFVVVVAGPIAVNCTSICKDVLLTYFGIIFFSNVDVTNELLLGISLSFAGAISAIAIKHQERKAIKVKQT